MWLGTLLTQAVPGNWKMPEALVAQVPSHVG